MATTISETPAQTLLRVERQNIPLYGQATPAQPAVGPITQNRSTPAGFGVDMTNRLFRYDPSGNVNPAPTGAAAGAAAPSPAAAGTVPSPAPGAAPGQGVGRVAPNPNEPLTPAEYDAKFGPQPVDEAGIRERIRRENQMQIDAINGAYNQMVQERGVVNEDLMGRTRSVSARGGLLGSDFGNANLSNQQVANEKAIQAINAERAMRIAGVYKEVSALAEREISAKKAEAAGKAEAYSGYLKENQGKAKEYAATIGASGLSFDELKSQNPNGLATLLKTTGYDEFTLAQVMNNSKKAAEKIDYTYKTVGNKVIGYGLNPKTGQIETVEKEIGGADNLQDYTPHSLSDGTLVFTPKQLDPTKPLKDQVLMYGAEGQFAKNDASSAGAPAGFKFVAATRYQPAGFFNPATGEFRPSTGGVDPKTGAPKPAIVQPRAPAAAKPKVKTTTQKVDAAISQITAGLASSNLLGPDGKISPQDYLALRNSWIKKELNPTTFDTKMKGYRDQNNPNYVTD